MNITEYNREAWDRQVERGDEWTIPVTPEQVAVARRGEVRIVLTPTRPVPAAWFPPLRGVATLCLAASGGQQAPLLAAAGAEVTVLDLSPKQLAQDRFVAEREGLTLQTVSGDMRDLRMFADASFDLIVHPVSNCFVPEVRPVWREAARVLRPGGVLLAGFFNPAVFIFHDMGATPDLRVRFPLPYSDIHSLSNDERDKLEREGEPFVFSHTLAELIGGQLEAGFVITGMYEDEWPGKVISTFMRAFIATRAVRN